MQISLLPFRKFFAIQTILFALTLVFAGKTNAQQSNQFAPKPKAILVAEWSDSGDESHSRQLPERSQVRARIFSNTNYKAVAPAVAAIAISAKSSSRFAALQPTELERQAFDLINEQRRLQNLPALEWDLGMLYVARLHSANMAKFHFFSHEGLDGKTADDRADEAGIKDWRMIGENIAFNQGVQNKAAFAVECWMKSPKHKENLLGKKWTRAGVGVAVTSDGKFYATQVFRN